MTSSTPSPSAQELADFLVEAAKVLRDESLDGVAMPETAKILDQSATLLRRLSETERERDHYRKLYMLECGETDRIAEIIGLNGEFELPEAVAMIHKERDALREMLAQADAVIDAVMSIVLSKDLPMPGNPTHVSEALARHRLSQKGSAS